MDHKVIENNLFLNSNTHIFGGRLHSFKDLLFFHRMPSQTRSHRALFVRLHLYSSILTASCGPLVYWSVLTASCKPLVELCGRTFARLLVASSSTDLEGTDIFVYDNNNTIKGALTNQRVQYMFIF